MGLAAQLTVGELLYEEQLFDMNTGRELCIGESRFMPAGLHLPASPVGYSKLPLIPIALDAIPTNAGRRRFPSGTRVPCERTPFFAFAGHFVKNFQNYLASYRSMTCASNCLPMWSAQGVK